MFELALNPRVQDTITIFLAIIIEAFPFIVIGVLVSSLLSFMIKDEWLHRLLPHNRIASHLVSASLGMFFPVCECGNVPVTRKLLAKGFLPSQAISFYLGSPILNIVVIVTTISAFSAQPIIIWGRVIGGLLIATVVGVIISYRRESETILTNDMMLACKHEHSQHRHDSGKHKYMNRLGLIVEKLLHEFMEMGGLLVIGAAIAAFTQLWLPRDFIYTLSSNPILSILAMMLLAFIISVCSTVDAFVALSYATVFSPAALLAFLIFGPMIDIKAISMLSSTYKLKFVIQLVLLVSLLTIMYTLFLSNVGF